MVVSMAWAGNVRMAKMTLPDFVVLFFTGRQLECSCHAGIETKQLLVDRAKVSSVSPVIINSHHGATTMAGFPELATTTSAILLWYLL